MRRRSCRRSRCPCGRSARRSPGVPRSGRRQGGPRPRRCRTARRSKHPRGCSPRPRAPRHGPRCARRRPRCRRTRLRGPRSRARPPPPRCDRSARASCRGPAALRPGSRRTTRCLRSSWRWPGSRPAREPARSRRPRRSGVRSRAPCAGRGGRRPCRSMIRWAPPHSGRSRPRATPRAGTSARRAPTRHVSTRRVVGRCAGVRSHAPAGVTAGMASSISASRPQGRCSCHVMSSPSAPA